MSDPREQVQSLAKQKWLASGRRNTIILGTGMGKSKVAIDLVSELDETRDGSLSILLLTNSETLRDTNWKDEFEKFGALDFYNNRIQSECYQTAYRWVGKQFDLVIADEIDFALTQEYSKFFTSNDCGMILGLTGFCNEDKKDMLNLLCPICFEYSTQEGQTNNLLNKSEIVLVNYTLSRVNDIKIMKKAGGFFMQSENALYKYYDSEFQKAIIIKSAMDKKMRLGEVVDPVKYKAAEWKFKIMASKRKSILNSSPTSVKVVKELLLKIHANPGNKVLIFSALTDQANRIGCATFHGKPSSTETSLDRLNNGEINTLAVCKAINRGVNLVGVNYIIKESFDSSETDFMQTHGRLMRLRPDQVGRYIVLIPHFEDLVRMPDKSFQRMLLTTQAEKWASKMMNSFDGSSTVREVTMTPELQWPAGTAL